MFEPCALTPPQEKLWEDTCSMLVWQCPLFHHVFYEMMNKAGSKYIARFTRDIPIAATDGATILLNPDTFFKLPLKQRTFVAVHEIMHCILNHLNIAHSLARSGKVVYPDGKVLPYQHMLMNRAKDYVINDLLIDASIGEFPTGDFEGLHDKSIATGNDSSIDAYRKIYEDDQNKGKGKGKGQPAPGNGGHGGFDQHLDPGAGQGKDAASAVAERNEGAWKASVQAGVAAARAIGKLPAGLDRFFKELLQPQVDWREKIESLFARRLGQGSYDWRRPDRRLIVQDIYAPGRSGFGAGTVVVGCDTSGSVQDPEIAMFMAEIGGILEDVRPQRIVLIWCDAKVHRVDFVDDAADLVTVRSKGAPGGGGTDFRPVFDWIADNRITPDALVFLTDLQGPFPTHAPNYSVIWGNIYKGATAPFGDVVDIPRQAAA